MHRPLIIALASALILLAACGEDEGVGPEVTPTMEATAAPAVTATAEATAPPAVTATPTAQAAVSPTAEAVACAAGSTEAFVEAQEQAPFVVYCPTFLPAGLTLEDVGYSPEDVTHGPTVGGAFTSSAPEVRVDFVQGGPLPLSLLTTGIRFGGGGPSGTMVPYADFDVELWLPGEPGMAVAVLGQSPDGATHWMVAQGLTEDELKEIAASMRPVSPTP